MGCPLSESVKTTSCVANAQRATVDAHQTTLKAAPLDQAAAAAYPRIEHQRRRPTCVNAY